MLFLHLRLSLSSSSPPFLLHFNYHSFSTSILISCLHKQPSCDCVWHQTQVTLQQVSVRISRSKLQIHATCWCSFRTNISVFCCRTRQWVKF
jgi:hypothetical protein